MQALKDNIPGIQRIYFTTNAADNADDGVLGVYWNYFEQGFDYHYPG